MCSRRVEDHFQKQAEHGEKGCDGKSSIDLQSQVQTFHFPVKLRKSDAGSTQLSHLFEGYVLVPFWAGSPFVGRLQFCPHYHERGFFVLQPDVVWTDVLDGKYQMTSIGWINMKT